MKAVNSALIGGVVWVGLLATSRPNLHDGAWAHALLLFAALVLVPLALDLFAEEGEGGRTSRLFTWVRRLQLPAALGLALAVWLTPGFAAGLAALPWAAWTGLLAAVGVLRLARGGWGRQLDQMCGDVAMIYSAIGGVWIVVDRAGWQPLGFDPAIVALTAVHFHYAGLLLTLFAGRVQRVLFFSRFASRSAVGVVLGVPAVAAGITATQFGWGPGLESAAGLGLALAGMSVAVLQVRLATERSGPVPVRVLMGVAGGSLFFGMVLAALYAVRAYAAPFPWLDVPAMRMLHGTVNAFGGGLAGVLAWRGMRG